MRKSKSWLKSVIDDATSVSVQMCYRRGLRTLMDHLPSQECRSWNLNFQKHKGRVVLRGDIVKDDSGLLLQYSQSKDSSASQMTAAKSHGHYIKATRMRRTSSRCSIRLFSGQNGRCSQIIEDSQIGRCTDVIESSRVRMSRYLVTSIKTQMVQITVQAWKTQSFFLCEICTVIRWFEKVLLKYGWEKVPDWECLLCKLRKRTILVCVCGRYEILAGKKQSIDQMWKILMKDVDLGEPTSFFDHVYLRCTQRECQICKDIVVNYKKYVRF